MSNNKTAEFLHHSYTWSRVSLRLRDVQPLFGGIDLLIPSWTSSQGYLTRIDPVGQVMKFRLPLDWLNNEKEALCQLCLENDFLTIQPAERSGLPDEARPSLTLTNSKGDSHTVAKWAGVKDDRFDAIYHALLAIAARSEGQRPIPQRFHFWQKASVLAGLVGLLLLLIWPAYALANSLAMAWWPARFGLIFLLLMLLLALLLGGMRGLATWEKRKPAWNRIFTHLWVTVPVNLLFAVAVICLFGLGETAVRLWWAGSQLTAGDERSLYVVVGYTAVFAAVLVVAAAGVVMPRLLNLIDERF